MYDSLILEGGGVRGIAYIGVVQCMQDNNLLKDIKYFAGSSAGSQAASLLAIGYNADEFKEIFISTDVEKFKDDSCGCCRDLWRFFNKFGYYKGEYLETYFDNLIERKLNKKNF